MRTVPKQKDYTVPPQRVLDLCARKLASSGLSSEDSTNLGMLPITASEADPTFAALGACFIPYYDLQGLDTGFFRIRYLEAPQGFGAQIAKPQRYVQSAGTLNWAYLPRLPSVDWQKLAKDASEPLYITEGEFKASCAAKHGFPTIGLGGVTVWESSKKGVNLLPPLDEFNWKGRQVTIIFDSDAADNPQVATAQVRLSKKLLLLGAVPKVASLPHALDGSKQGLDDFLVAGGDLGAVLSELRPLELGERLAQFNQNYAYVVSQDVVLSLPDGMRCKRDAFVNGIHANAKMYEVLTLANGNTKRTELSLPKEWLEWASRRDVAELVYSPGQPRLFDKVYNTWKGWGCEPSPGSLAPWNALLTHTFSESPGDRTWFEQWLAYPLQHPGTKLYTGCLFWGPETGTGKSLIGETMRRIYGENFTVVENADLFSPFNEWAECKQFVMGDEISGSDKRQESDKLKGMVTRLKVRINAKHLPKYEIKDCINYYFTSNHANGLFLDDRDRRWFIHRMPAKHKPRSFFIEFMQWLDHDGGQGALFHHLLNLDLTGFDPAAMAPVTHSKLEMIDHGKSDIAAFVAELRANSDMLLQKLRLALKLRETPDLVLNKHVRMLYDPHEKTRVTAIGVGRALASAAVRSVNVHSKQFGQQRFYAIKNEEKWLSAQPEALIKYIDQVYQGSEESFSKF